MTIRDNTDRQAAGETQDKQVTATAGSPLRPWFWVGLVTIMVLVLYLLWQLPTPGMRG